MGFDKGIPIPRRPDRFKRGGPTLAGVEGMEVGDSLFHPKIEYDHTQPGRISASATYYGRKHGTEYEVQQVEGGVRVWRVK